MGDYQGRSTIVFFFFCWAIFFILKGEVVVLPVLLGVIDDQSQTAWTSLTVELGGRGPKRGERERL